MRSSSYRCDHSCDRRRPALTCYVPERTDWRSSAANTPSRSIPTRSTKPKPPDDHRVFRRILGKNLEVIFRTHLGPRERLFKAAPNQTQRSPPRAAAARCSVAQVSSCICYSKVGHLVVVRFQEGRSGRRPRDVGAASRVFCEPIEPVYRPQHVRHQKVSYAESTGCQPLAAAQQRFHPIKPGLQEFRAIVHSEQ
jgi:hypothetical protein